MPSDRSPHRLDIQHQLLLLEPLVHRPPFGTPPEALDALISPGFWEIAASGLRHERKPFLALLRECASRPHQEHWEPVGPQCPSLGEHTYLLSYTLQQPLRDGTLRWSHRTSLWQLTDQGWQTMYHQGTVILQAPS
jgi:hypothetical protein